MGRYGFTSPGADAGQAIQQFLVQRAMQQRQAEMDARAQEREAAQLAHQGEELKLQQAQEKRAAEAQKTQTADLQNQREFTKATTIANAALPGDAVDQPTREMLGRQGYGGQIKQVPGIVAQGAFQGNDAQDIPQYDVTKTPDSYAMRGGSQYLSARAAADERAAESDKTRTAASERADSDRAMRLTIAELMKSNSAESHALANQLTQLRIDAEKTKQEDAKTAATNKRTAVRQPAQDALDLIDTIIDPTSGALLPGVSGVVGAKSGAGWIPGTDAASAITRIDRLKSLMDLDVIAQMKAQSKTGATGFGAMSAPELKILEDAAARLNRSQSEAAFTEELARLKEKLQRVVAEPDGAPTNTGAPAPGGGGFRVVASRPK